jgi:hypothetical protein
MSLQDKAIDIKGKKYVLVADRVIYFNEKCLDGAITTKLISAPTDERVVIKATVTPDCSVPQRKFTAYSQALWGDGYINKTSAIENCETSAVGRALGLMGIGVIDSIASKDEIDKAEIQSRMQTAPQAIQEIGKILEDKGITEPEAKQRIVRKLTDGQALNTSGIARLKKEIVLATSGTLQELAKESE